MTDIHCALCTLGLHSARPPGTESTPVVVAYLDDELIALVAADLPGAMLAPRSHVRGLPAQPGLAGPFLAALRKVVLEVQSLYETSGTMIEPTTDLPGAAGHVCYQVMPTIRHGPVFLPSTEVRALSLRLAEVLGGHIVPRRTRHAGRPQRSLASFHRPFGLVDL